jgi:2-succinyl-5-enolpyruvyl-6-hydroxy-3-cyclohexene-1-carboxylate synthase
VLTDPLSGLRSLAEPHASLLAAYDAFLRPRAVVESLRPGFVLRLGDPPTSKPLATYLARHRDVT